MPIRRWLTNRCSLLLVLRLVATHWSDENRLLPPPILSISLLPSRAEHIVFFAKAIAAELCIRLTAACKASSMMLADVVSLLASIGDNKILAIARDDDRKF